MGQATNRVWAKAEHWLREKEGQVLPRWVSELRRKGGLFTAGRTTQELKQHVFLIYYDRLCQSVCSGETDGLDLILRRLVAEHVRQNYDIKQILQFPLQLKSVLWRLIFQEPFPDHAREIMDQIEYLLDYSLEVLVETYTQETEAAFNTQLEELDFLTKRLALSGEETERAFMQLRSLYDISRAITSTLDIHQTLEAIANSLVSIPFIGRCTIWLVTGENTLQVGVTQGSDDTLIGNVTLSLDNPTSFVTEALLARHKRRLNDKEDALAFFLEGRTAMAIPMVTEGHPVGVVMIDGQESGESFGSSTLSLIQSAADQAAIALENAQLYGQVTRFNQELEAKVEERTRQLQEANQELERVNRDLERLDRTKSDFISIAAHELKTPLTLIQGYTNILRDDETINGNPFLLNVLDGIIKGSERLYRIIESMIDVSLIDSRVLQLRPSKTSVRNLLKTLTDQHAGTLEERSLTLCLNDLSGLPYVEADSQRLYQVFENLLINAIKYTPDGGCIEICGSQIAAEDQELWIEVVFSDSGIGINPEHQEHIFDKFYQTGQVALHSSGKTKFKGGGPGLGLAIAKGIVDAHGGKIWVESDKQDETTCPGSKFHILLPVKSRVSVVQVHSPFSYSHSADGSREDQA